MPVTSSKRLRVVVFFIWVTTIVMYMVSRWFDHPDPESVGMYFTRRWFDQDHPESGRTHGFFILMIVAFMGAYFRTRKQTTI